MMMIEDRSGRGKRLRLWCPKARQVEVDLQGERRKMEADSKGWWTLADTTMEHGWDYAFHVDGAGPFPDPRSRWQPKGPHGPSRWVDHELYPWSDTGWQAPPLASAIIYELHIGTFTPEGTYAAATEKLDHLVDLGVNFIEVMPVAQFEGRRGWGYDGVDLYAPHSSYGDPDDLKSFVDASHEKGLAVILDVVYNHLGPSGNYLSQFGPYFTDRYKTAWGSAVNLDGPGSHEARRFFMDSALMWLRDYHFDGLRLDAVHAFMDTSALHFLEELAQETRQLEASLQRRFALIAESDLNDPRIVRGPEVGGYGLDAQWNEDFHHALHALLTGEDFAYFVDFGSVADLARALGHAQVYSGQYSRFRDRNHGRPPLGLGGERFVACLQNHDQIGNRGCGERVNHLVPLAQFKLGAAVNLLSPFVPLLFQGEEWAASSPFLYFTDFEDEELAEAVRVGRRDEFKAFGWKAEAIADPQAEETFLRSKLRWEEIEGSSHAEALEWYRELIRLRRAEPDFACGPLDPEGVRFSEEEGWLLFRRGRHWVACNFSKQPRRLELPQAELQQIALRSDSQCVMDSSAVELAPWGVLVADPR